MPRNQSEYRVSYSETEAVAYNGDHWNRYGLDPQQDNDLLLAAYRDPEQTPANHAGDFISTDRGDGYRLDDDFLHIIRHRGIMTTGLYRQVAGSGRP